VDWETVCPIDISTHKRYSWPVMDHALGYGTSLNGGGSSPNGGRSVLTSSTARSLVQGTGSWTRSIGLVSYEPEDQDSYSRNNLRGCGVTGW
jgi:hypothetical protein